MNAAGRALLGLALAAAGFLSYFAFSAKSELLRARTWPNWILLVLGALVAAHAALRPRQPISRAGRIVAVACLALALGGAGLFGWYTLGPLSGLPAPVAERIAPGRALPDLELAASDGAKVNLLRESRDGFLRGRKLVLSFFRGVW